MISYDWSVADSQLISENCQTALGLWAHHGLISPWPRFYLVYMSVCNNSLKLYHGEISRLCYIAGHYRTTTCITSSVFISQNGCWGAQQEGRWLPQLCYSGCAGLRRLCFSSEAVFLHDSVQ